MLSQVILKNSGSFRFASPQDSSVPPEGSLNNARLWETSPASQWTPTYTTFHCQGQQTQTPTSPPAPGTILLKLTEAFFCLPMPPVKRPLNTLEGGDSSQMWHLQILTHALPQKGTRCLQAVHLNAPQPILLVKTQFQIGNSGKSLFKQIINSGAMCVFSLSSCCSRKGKRPSTSPTTDHGNGWRVSDHSQPFWLSIWRRSACPTGTRHIWVPCRQCFKQHPSQTQQHRHHQGETCPQSGALFNSSWQDWWEINRF